MQKRMDASYKIFVDGKWVDGMDLDGAEVLSTAFGHAQGLRTGRVHGAPAEPVVMTI